jgi:hypothetical protein
MAFYDGSGVMGGSPLPTAHLILEKEHLRADTFGLPPPKQIFIACLSYQIHHPFHLNEPPP